MGNDGASLVELAEDSLTAKRALESAAQAQKGHSDRARRQDLARWGRLLNEVLGRDVETGRSLDLEVDLAPLGLADLHTEVILAGVALAKMRWSENTVSRMLSTLRGFTAWLTRRELLRVDPGTDSLLHASGHHTERRPRALDDDDVAALLNSAALAPTGRQRMFWPERDVALIAFMSTTGARAEEICSVTIGEIDRRPERPIWRVGRAKGDKHRDVPLPCSTVAALDAWITARREQFPTQQADALFVRPNGSALDVNVLDRILRGLALRAAVSFPVGAAAHALRHTYGVTLALRGVPQSVIAQLMGHADPRTTSIYTTVASTQLIAALDDAGML